MSVGRVALVGAGPGDPALLTVRAAELLRAADVVAHDELVSESILALVPVRAELVAVGRRAGSGDTGHRLHPIVLARALAGHFVVRLKAGDPLVFGRGGEEASELAAAGIPFEIVPGISAALGAASYAGIPLTHREHSAQVVITTGHRADGGMPPPGTSAGRTLALYMAVHELATNLGAIVAAGWPPSTPAALVIAATTPDQRTIVGTLATLAARADCAPSTSAKLPSLVLVGDVVTLRTALDWRSRLPLHGRRVIVARTRPGASRVAMAMRTLGADVVELPHVAVANERGTPPARWPSRVDLVVLPAAAAADALYAEAPSHIRAAPAVAIGARTEEAARRLGAFAIVRAESGTIEALVAAAERILCASKPSTASAHASPAETGTSP